MQQKKATNLISDFYDTARHYRMTVEKMMNQKKTSFRFSANAVTLQKQPQSGQKSKKNDNSDEKKRNK